MPIEISSTPKYERLFEIEDDERGRGIREDSLGENNTSGIIQTFIWAGSDSIRGEKQWANITAEI